MRIFAILLLTGCSTLSWACPVPAVVTLEDAKTTVKCPSSGQIVTITHPVKP